MGTGGGFGDIPLPKENHEQVAAVTLIKLCLICLRPHKPD